MKTFNITERQFKILIEAARIRPWSDEDYKKVNPLQRNDVDFKQLRDLDKATGDENSNIGKEMFSNPYAFNKKNINKVQKKLTKKAQERYMKANGKNVPVMDRSELGNIGGKKLEQELLANGMKLEIAGRTFSYGNKKLPENTLVVNLTSAFNCPSIENGECPFGKICYGKGIELYSKGLMRKNLRNEHGLKYLSVKEILELVETYIEQAPVRIKYIRVSEEGDFKDQETVNFCDKLAGHLKAKYGIQTTAYTHRRLDYSNIHNMIINASSYYIKSGDRYFIPVAPEDYDKIPDGLDFSGKDIPMLDKDKNKVDTTHGTFKCPCDCRVCGFCYRTKEENGEPENNMITVVETIR